MPVYQEFINLNQRFQQLTEPPIFINDLANTTEEEREHIDKLIVTKYSSDTISILPRCQCGKTKGEFLVGVVCDSCHTEVRQTDSDLDSILWLRKMPGIIGLFNPHFWIMLEKFLIKSSFNVLRWLTDTTYNPPINEPPVIKELKLMPDIKRGYNYFVENFDLIFNQIVWLKPYGTTAAAKQKRSELIKIVEDYRDCLIADQVPLPNKTLLVIENTNKGVYVDFNITELLDAITMAVNTTASLSGNMRTLENRASKIMFKLSTFYKNYYSKFWSTKHGMFRKHIFGSRTHFSFRAVITSITEPHTYDEIHCPWGIGLTVFRPHIINKLVRRGYTTSDAIELIFSHVNKYSPVIDEVLQELLRDANGRICVLLQRNPSLLLGSAQRVYISKFKIDPKDTTIGMSILIVPAPNAD